MNDMERFKAVALFQRPDYVPIFGNPGSPGMSRGCMKKTHDRLVQTGMPAHVGGCLSLSTGWSADVESWFRYWGTTGPDTCDISLGRGAKGFAETRRIDGEYEIIESESGTITRQLIDNDITYSMPEYIAYPVRDRTSWEFYRERMTPAGIVEPEEIERACRRCDNRNRPLLLGCGGTYGMLRGLMGPEGVSLTFYDDPELIHDMVAWQLENFHKYSVPLIERLRPEIVGMGEDLCYNHGMLLSPAQFHEFCGGYYREVCEAAGACGADLIGVDTDGNLMEFADVASEYGVSALFPCEVKAGNDLFLLRERHPGLVLFGWLEKEAVNESNEHLIEGEIMTKVPRLLEKGGYFPNGDHGIQPFVTFENMCKFMTLLHEVTGNPEGEFPRARL